MECGQTNLGGAMGAGIEELMRRNYSQTSSFSTKESKKKTKEKLY